MEQNHIEPSLASGFDELLEIAFHVTNSSDVTILAECQSRLLHGRTTTTSPAADHRS